MSEYTAYRNKMSRRGRNLYERTYNKKRRSFVNWYENALNRESCIIDGIPSQAVFQDHSQSNNKDLSDDKYVVTENETQIGIGSYVDWRDREWLVFTEEEKTIPTHQQLKIKEVNWNIKWLKDGEVVNNGLGYGAYVQNQTLYTLGVAFVGDLASIANGKMMMYVQNNVDTRDIRIGQRVYIGESVYKILFKDPISRQGLINFLMEQDQEHPDNDNPELGVADYYTGGANPTMETHDPDKVIEIQGDGVARVGSRHTYRISDEDRTVDEWIVNYMDSGNSPFRVIKKDEKEVELEFVDDHRNLGKIVNIYAILDDGSTADTSIQIITKY